MERFLGRFGRDRQRDGGGILESCFGPLEVSVLEALWRRDGEASVRGLADDFPEAAYTTLMTTLDRLFKKGALARRKSGRAFVYRARRDRAELEADLARDAFDVLFASRMDRAGANVVISGLVDAVGDQDARLLDDLERLVREKRAEGASRATGKRETE